MNQESAQLTQNYKLEETAPQIEAAAEHATKSEILRSQKLDVSQGAPILTAGEVEARYGVPLGRLQAIVRLPFRQSALHHFPEGQSEANELRTALSVYCFSDDSKGRHAAPGFHLMGQGQLEQLQEYYLGTIPDSPEIGESILSLEPGDRVSIGRGNWLPSVGHDVSLLESDEDLARRHQSVSREQAVAEVDEAGHLWIMDDASYNGTEVVYRPEVQ